MTTIGVMANGPQDLLPDLVDLRNLVDIWIGADGGALTLINHGINVDYAVGDFDSITLKEKSLIKQSANHFQQYPSEKDETDLERSEEHTSELQSRFELVCRLLLEKKKKKSTNRRYVT